jgi:DNA polymerase (family 10)
METELGNGDVARIFARIAAVMEIQGENAFKIRAYRNAVETLSHLSEPVSALAREDRLAEVPGFGDAIQAKIKDILSTGTTPLYERLKDKVPEGVIEMLELPGVGAKIVRQLWEGLKIESVDALEAAASEGKLTELPGMGEKTVAKILDAIERGRRYANRLRIDEAEPVADAIASALSAEPATPRAEVAGDLRRRADSVTAIEIVAQSNDFAATLAKAVSLPQVESVAEKTEESVRLVLHSGLPVAISVTEAPSFAVALAALTGARSHWDALTEIAARRGLRLTSGGLWSDDRRLPIDDEPALYEALGLPFIVPELREGRGEIEAALAGTLPKLITLQDIRGDLHAHTTASDGKATLIEMATAARAHGYEYMAITDHSQSLAIAGGLTPERLLGQIREARAAEDRVGIRIYAGSEVDIRADGTMDYDDSVLSQLDFVIGSAHMHNRQDREAQTKRVIRAIENPHVDMIAHPTARLINRRDPFSIDLEAMIEAAVRTGTALEINAAPERLDLSAENAKLAAQMGAHIMIDTDAHAIGNYDLMHYGIDVARRAWLTADQVLNTRSRAGFESWLFRER